MSGADHVAITEAEWKIMVKLWEHSPQTMMELTRSLAAQTGWTKHTVITMLKRMAQKGTVLISEEGPVKQYSPGVEKARVAREQTQTLLSRLFGGRASLLLCELVDSGDLSAQELEELQKILDEAASPKQENERQD
ncbi:MAG: BlaI/MecI/CopY family transcriptional regulator [Clostridia bacterium]